MPRDTYTPLEWEDTPKETTPINSERLGYIENGIKTAMDNRALKEVYDDTAISMGRKSSSGTGSNSLAIGENAEASGNNSFSFGGYTVASGKSSHAEGNNARATGDYAHAEGNGNASGTKSHAENEATATGNSSHAEGQGEARGYVSHAEGYFTVACGDQSKTAQHVQGRYNIEDTKVKYAHIVGNGTSDSKRSNAHTLDWDGNAWFAGDVTTDEVSLAALNSSLLSASVDITDKCRYQVTGQSLEIDVPTEGISVSQKEYMIIGGLYWGIVKFQQRPYFRFLAQISRQFQQPKRPQDTIDGFAYLINDYSAYQEQFGDVLHGEIDMSSVSADGEYKVTGTAKLTFDVTPPKEEISASADVTSIQIFKALPINDIMTRLTALEETVAGLSGGGGLTTMKTS